MVGGVLIGWIVPPNVLMAICEVEICVVENRRPFEWWLRRCQQFYFPSQYAFVTYSMQPLTRYAMTKFSSHRHLTVELILHFPQ
jgi:hypothetical protein